MYTDIFFFFEHCSVGNSYRLLGNQGLIHCRIVSGTKLPKLLKRKKEEEISVDGKINHSLSISRGSIQNNKLVHT